MPLELAPDGVPSLIARRDFNVSDSAFKFSEYYDRPKRIAGVWTLHKDKHTATWELWTHPVGAELRVEVDGELQ